MREKVTPGTVRDYGREVAGLDVSDTRAAEIAPEVEGLNGAALEAAARLDLNDEPGQFPLALARNRRPHGKAR